MRELVKIVADGIRDLETLKLLDENNVTTSLRLEPKTKKYALEVAVSVASPEILNLCLIVFGEIREKTRHSMGVLENDLRSKLIVEFYEQ